MTCACSTLLVLTGNEAQQYGEEHLEKLKVDAANWTKLYRCPITGVKWLMDFPESGLQGGGPPRLRQLAPDGQPVEGPSIDPHR